MKMEKVDIILPVYNGAQYIGELLDSILSQTYSGLRIIIRDDGSSDSSMSILHAYMMKYPEKIRLLKDNLGNLGVVRNVFEIMKYSSAHYIMLCDQDDVWFKNKIHTLMKCIKKKEKEHPQLPILIHSEAVITDEQLNIINASFSQYSGLDRRRTQLCNLLQKNVVQGASAIFNRSLLTKANLLIHDKNDTKKTIVYHDLWLAVIAAAFGKIYYYSKPLMYYRQHSKNLVGAAGGNSKKLFSKFADKEFDKFRYNHYLAVYDRLCDQLCRIYRDQLQEEHLSVLEHFRTRPSDMYQFFCLRLYRYYTLEDIILMLIYGIKKW